MRVCVCISFINFDVFLYDCEPLKSMRTQKKLEKREVEGRQGERKPARIGQKTKICLQLPFVVVVVAAVVVGKQY